MAISLPNHSVLAPLRPSVSLTSSKPTTTKPSKSLALCFPSSRHFHSRAHLRNPALGFPRTSSFAAPKTSTTRFAASAIFCFDAFVNIDLLWCNITKFQVEGDEKESSPSTDTLESSGLSLKNLFNLYKEAILDGDEQTVFDIEARIDVIGNDQDKLVEKVSTLTEEIKSGKEKYVRLQADFDNFRKRSEKERLSVRSDAQGEVIESLLPMVDNFERAKQQIKPETEKEKQIDASYQGIYKQFVEILRSLRVAVVPTVGKPFDPSLHEAIAREESQEFEEGIIIEEFRRGFILGDRLIRPSMVKVSSGPGRNASSVAPASSGTTAAVPE
ncbi:Protein grpE [Morus notabilis]|uniref:GrpE protein homolog n=1 Tax=Morus notabilis TaxID=981085 RepID=W9R7B8_9ROSA|nr:Protein grpE [Morus notabilis]